MIYHQHNAERNRIRTNKHIKSKRSYIVQCTVRDNSFICFTVSGEKGVEGAFFLLFLQYNIHELMHENLCVYNDTCT